MDNSINIASKSFVNKFANKKSSVLVGIYFGEKRMEALQEDNLLVVRLAFLFF